MSIFLLSSRSFGAIGAVTVVSLALLTALPFGVLAERPDNSTPYPKELYAQCFDGKDNDKDGLTDLADPDCPKCEDNIDNDGDGLIDEKDPDCPQKPVAKKKSLFGRLFASAFLGTEFESSPEDSATIAFSPRSLNYGGEIYGGGYITSAGAIPTEVWVGRPRLDGTVPEVRGGGSIPTGTIASPNPLPRSSSINAGGTISAGGTIPGGGTI